MFEFKNIFSRLLILFATTAALTAGGFGAAGATEDTERLVEDAVVPKVRQFIAKSLVIDAVRAQNRRHESLNQAQIDEMDRTWRSETERGGGRLSSSVMSNPLSRYLADVKQGGQGLYTEIFVMDSRGLNVGQSDLTSDYWQGDEAKWQQTFGKGPGAMHIGDVEFDESSQTFQSQLSLPVVDPASGAVIGAITVGVNMDLLH